LEAVDLLQEVLTERGATAFPEPIVVTTITTDPPPDSIEVIYE
jgi:hypothetical protein